MTQRIGLIGGGAIAQAAHLPGYVRAGCTIVAIADPRPEVADELQARGLPVPKLYPDHRAMLAAESLDAVSICTPNVLHAPVFLDCVGAVKAILLEKPVALDLASAEAMRTAAQRHGTRVMVAFSHRFSPLCLAVKTALKAGEIGRPYHLRVRFAHMGPIPGWAKTDWFYDPVRAGGGALLDMGIHAIDLMRWFIGEADAVSARTATLRKPIAVDDNAVMLFELGQHCLATIEAGWTSPAGFVGVEVLGDGGAIIADYGANRVDLLTGGRKPDGSSNAGRRELYGGNGTSHWTRQMEMFTSALASGDDFQPNLDDGIAALRLALAAAESSRTGLRQQTGY